MHSYVRNESAAFIQSACDAAIQPRHSGCGQGRLISLLHGGSPREARPDWPDEAGDWLRDIVAELDGRLLETAH
jgi:hypothetical protein